MLYTLRTTAKVRLLGGGTGLGEHWLHGHAGGEKTWVFKGGGGGGSECTLAKSRWNVPLFPSPECQRQRHVSLPAIICFASTSDFI